MLPIKNLKVNGVAYQLQSHTPIKEQTSTSISIEPNVLNRWGVVAELTLVLTPPENTSVVNEYMVQFTSGETPTILNLPSNVVWIGTPIFETNKTYIVSIIDNMAIVRGSGSGGSGDLSNYYTKDETLELINTKLEEVEYGTY